MSVFAILSGRAHVGAPYGRCADCEDPLTPEEQRYYEYRCEVCEGFWHERLQAWRAGAHDPELSRMFSA